ncbi:hypothetical protein V5O48_008792 [Marasmius crinis-equi]|uniref:Xylanolytic transcriptional activator regulatory domain-containing protein n=1 Tax=Marasmius crinis-equi TaxID=585013 RepID=A0ABR3FCW8_9AGAR
MRNPVNPRTNPFLFPPDIKQLHVSSLAFGVEARKRNATMRSRLAPPVPRRTRNALDRVEGRGRERAEKWKTLNVNVLDWRVENIVDERGPMMRNRISTMLRLNVCAWMIFRNPQYSTCPGQSSSSDEASPISPTTNFQLESPQQARPYMGTFFPPSLPEPYQRPSVSYNTESILPPIQTHHTPSQHRIPRSSSSLVPYTQALDQDSTYQDQLPVISLTCAPSHQPLPVSDPSQSTQVPGNPYIDSPSTVDHLSRTGLQSSHTQNHAYHNTSLTTTPPQLGDVVHSLSKQVAFLEGDPGESQTLKVHYYRLTGCTAIHPGFNRIVITLRSSDRSCSSGTGSPGGSSHSLRSPGEESLSSTNSALDDLSSRPPPLDDVMLDTFFNYFGQHCPFMRRDKVEERIKAGTMSAFLGFAMCAVAVRFVPKAKFQPSQFIDAAWKLVLPLLRLPSTDVVAGLLMLSWAEFGENSESGLWNFLGLAIRMAIDLGLHKSEDPDVIPIDDVCNGKVLFWSLFVMDRILAFGTGRAVTIPCDCIEVSTLDEMDMSGPSSPHNSTTPQVLSPYVQIVKLFVLAGHIANCMNNAPITPMYGEIQVGGETLQSLHNRLVDFIAGLPPSLTWSVDNFRAQAAWKQGGPFLFLHLWIHAILALLHHPDLGKDSTGSPTPGLKRSIKLSLVSSRQIVDCLVFADLFDDLSYCSCPFLNQCLFIAGVAFIHDTKAAQTIGLPSSSLPQDSEYGGPIAGQHIAAQSEFISGLCKQHLLTIFKALRKMESYWSGLGYVINALEQRASGRGWSNVDFSTTSEKSDRFISLPDMGLLKKLTGVDAMGDEYGRDHEQVVANEPPPVENVNSLSQVLQQVHYQQPPQHYQSTPIMSPVRIRSLSRVHAADWSFDSLLGTYRVQEVSASGVDFSSVYPGGVQW